MTLQLSPWAAIPFFFFFSSLAAAAAVAPHRRRALPLNHHGARWGQGRGEVATRLGAGGSEAARVARGHAELLSVAGAPPLQKRRRRQPRAGESLSGVPASHPARRGSSGTAEGKISGDRGRSRADGGAGRAGEGGREGGGRRGARTRRRSRPPPVNSKGGGGTRAEWEACEEAREKEGNGLAVGRASEAFGSKSRGLES